jgi:hypothetical protein
MDASAPLLRHDDPLVATPDDPVWLAIRAIRVDPPSPATPPSATTPATAPSRATVRALRPSEGDRDAAPAALPFCSDGRFARYFDRLAALDAGLAPLRRLVLHVDAALAADDRVALYRALWRAVRASPPSLRQRAARLFDARHAGLLGWCETPWSDPITHRRLAQAHLPGARAERLEWQGPPDAAFVVALLTRTTVPSDEIAEAIDTAPVDRSSGEASPVADAGHAAHASHAADASHVSHVSRTSHASLDDHEPLSLDPASMLLGLQACLQGMAWGDLLDERLAVLWREATLDVAAADATLEPHALRTLFLLAMAQGDHTTAVRRLADCIRGQAHLELTPPVFRRWLEADAGDSALDTLRLAPALEAKWCRPWSLHSASFRAALGGAFRRPAVRARLQALEAALAGMAPSPLDLEPCVPAQVLRGLSRLDGLRHRLDAGLPIGRSGASLLDSDVPGDEAVALLQRHRGVDAMAAGDPHAAAIALAAARSAGCPRSSALLQRLFESVDAAAWQAATDTTGTQWWHMDDAAPHRLGMGWQTEEPVWLQLARHGSPVVASMAAHQLAVLYTEGCLQPCDGPKRPAALTALGLWTELRSEPAYEAEATRRLDSLAMRAAAAHGFQQDGLDWLCVPAAEADADRLLIVFTGFANRHGFDHLELVNGFAGHHLLFLHDPLASGYAGDTFDRLRDLVHAHVGPLFDPSRVTCLGNAAGATGALKMAMHFGFRAVVTNPAIHGELDAAFGRGPRMESAVGRGPRLESAHGRSPLDAQPDTRVAPPPGTTATPHLTDWPIDAFERAPVCLRVGARPADREAFALWLERARRCETARFIVEKFDDDADDRDGSDLLHRVAPKRGVARVLAATIDRLGELAAIGTTHHASIDGKAAPPIDRSHAEVPAALLPRFWERLDEAPRLKLEIVIEGGRVFVADSLHTGTSASVP